MTLLTLLMMLSLIHIYSLIFLADVIIENNGRVRVVDLDELGDALTENIISCELMSDALHKLNKLLTAIYNGTFNEYIRILESHE